MPAFQNRAQQSTSEELTEFSNYGPFGGIQSEVPLDLVERYGFTDCLNVILRRAVGSVRSGFETLPALPAPSTEPIMGVADFFDTAGARVQVVMTPTRLLWWDPGSQNWTQITGVLTGDATTLYTWSVVNQKLCFSQGVDPVQLWDGITAGFAVASVDAKAARFLFELDNHLIAAYTNEGGQPYTQRVRWTAAGDPSDWVGFNAGVVDILGDLGPITGGCRIFQTGYIFHQWGITQMVPTGQTSNPFQFIPITTRSRGNIVPYSLAVAGEEFACYVGKDNVYMFNGTNSTPIGDSPMEGKLRIGARSRIFYDLGIVNQAAITAYISDNVNGQNYAAYWLVLPGVAIWVYSLDEQSWTRFTFDNVYSQIGRFYAQHFVRWIDLIGTWQQQNWTWDSLTANNPFDSILLGSNVGVGNLVEFTNVSEKPWAINGVFVLADPRHNKSIKKFRITILDNGPVTFTVTLTNQFGNVVTQTATMGTASGLNISQVLALPISGIRFAWQINGEAGQPFTLVEFAPMFMTSGEQRGGAVDS